MDCNAEQLFTALSFIDDHSRISPAIGIAFTFHDNRFVNVDTVGSKPYGNELQSVQVDGIQGESLSKWRLPIITFDCRL